MQAVAPLVEDARQVADEEERRAAFMTEDVVERYYEKQYSGQSGMRVPLLDPDFWSDKLRGRPYRHRRQ